MPWLQFCVAGFDCVVQASFAGFIAYPSNSLRLITRDPHLIFDAKLPLNEWMHVAATVNGKTGKQVLFINGKAVTESQ